MRLDGPVAELAASLEAAGTEARATHERAYLKSTMRHFGCRVPEVRRAARVFRRAHASDRPSLLAAADRLWGTGVFELRRATTELLRLGVDSLEPRLDTALVERLLRESRTWALVDDLAVHTAGPLLLRHPEEDAVLSAWGADDDLWIRRSALLTHLRVLRGKARLSTAEADARAERFFRLAGALAGEAEFFLRKAIGWGLRDAVRGGRGPRVVHWLEEHLPEITLVTLREPLRALPEDVGRGLRAAYDARRR